jgi:tetratricopeptide (TPR) repeat protein
MTFLRAWPRRVGRRLMANLTWVLMLAVGLVLAPLQPAYNHTIGAYALVCLLVFNFKLWQGRTRFGDLLFPGTFSAASLWILWYGNADIVPHLGTVIFGLMAAIYLASLALRRPLKFRDETRVAENYLDTGLRAALALACVAMSWTWMPHPRYLTMPILALLVFRLAAPVRRLLYPLLLKLVGLQPTSGRVSERGAPQPGFTRPRLAVMAVSLLLVAFVAPRLVFTGNRYDLTIPPPYYLPLDLLHERRAELEPYVAQPPGSQDAAALTELGLVYHSLGLLEQADLERAEVVLRRAMFLDPDNAQAVAWYGSTLVAGAIYETRPMRRTRFVEDGLQQLDRAVRMAPDDPIVRLARADICLGVPRFIRRIGVARQDVEHLLELARTHPRETDPILPLVYQRAGDAYALLGESEKARHYWQAALEELPEPSQDYKMIAAQLASLGPGSGGTARRLAEWAQRERTRP